MTATATERNDPGPAGETTSAALDPPRGLPATAGVARIDHEDPPGLGAQALDVVGNRRVPGQVVARPDLEDLVALGHPPAAGQDEMVLVAGVGVDPGRAARRDDCLEDPDVPGGPAVDLLHRPTVDPGDPGPLRGPDDARRRRRVEEEPGDGDLEGLGDRDQGIEGWHGLAVLDLAQVADVEVAPVADLGEGETACLPPAPDLATDVGAACR